MFDLTTTAQWHGPTVGIVRVEQELARRARDFLGDDVAFCLHDRSRTEMLILDHSVADEILSGKLRVDLSTAQAAPHKDPATGRPDLRSSLRTALLRNAAAYQLVQRLRGRSLTRAQIRQLQAQELPKRAEGPAAVYSESLGPSHGPKPVPLNKLGCHTARLDEDTCIISGGLDWRYKNLRSLWSLKQTYRFSYCAVLYDLIPLRYPQFVVAGYSEELTDYFGELLWVADRAICISEATRRDWIHFADEMGAPSVPADVFPLGCDLPASLTGQPQISLPAELRGKRFALYVSTIEPRKNHRMLYEAWDECIRTGRVDAERDRLVFVGRRGWATDDLLREIETNPLTRDTIVVLHDVDDARLSALYRTCAFVVFPSLTEGFGLPLVEALGYGKLCVTTNAGALSEIGDDLVMRLDPLDTLAWASTIGRLMANQPEIDQWEARARLSYRPTTWDDAAHRFFNAVTKSKAARPTRTSH